MTDSKRGRGGNKIGAAKARDILKSYIEKGKSKVYEDEDEDESIVFTVEDLQGLEDRKQAKEEAQEVVKEAKVEKVPEAKEVKENYKEMYDMLNKDMAKLKEEVSKGPKIVIKEKTSKELRDDALRNRLLNSFK